MAIASPSRFTELQGQYLAFIHAYALVNGRPPAEADMQRFFNVTPPSVHNMVKTLERLGLITRAPASHEASPSQFRRTSYPASGNRSKPLGRGTSTPDRKSVRGHRAAPRVPRQPPSTRAVRLRAAPGHAISSGITEGVCKAVVGMRCKRSGQRWRERASRAA
jgi:hypothetical protein